MRSLKIATALTAMLVTAPAAADSLGAANAFAAGVQLEKFTAVSNGVGMRVKRGQTERFGANVDRDFPGMAKLRMVYERDGYQEIEHCGGSVIGGRWIVTAAHCVQGPTSDQWDRIEVKVGDRSLDGPTVIDRIAHDVIIHAGFDYSYLANDIALIRLSEPLPRSIAPVALDEFRRPSVRKGELARAAGFPVTGKKAGQRSLQNIRLAVTDVEWPGYITVTSPTRSVEGVCQGESGGPLMGMTNGRPTLAGVLSGIEPNTHAGTSEPCMKAGYDMFYTPIAAYRDWIDTVRNLCDVNPDACRGAGEANFFLAGYGAGKAAERMAAAYRN